MPKQERKIETFKVGLVNSPKINRHNVPRGGARSVLNFVTVGDLVELRRGSEILGNEILGNGKITGLAVAERADTTQVLWRTRGKKIEAYNSTTDNWDECGSDTLGTAADGEDVEFAPYQTNHGSQMFASSPNSGMFKFMVANPTDVTSLYDAAKNFKGYIKIRLNRMFLWQPKNDKTAPYLSYIDSLLNTTVTNENIGTGTGAQVTFSGTLAFRAGDTKRTAFAIVVTDGVETFSDNNSGGLVGSLGGSGTINYTTGAISVTFNTAPTLSTAILATYQWEMSNNNGITDFTFSTPTRAAGQGDVFRQDDGGYLQDILFYGNNCYCYHRHKTWRLNLSDDDTNATNEIYRDRLGIPNHRAAVEAGTDIYFMDDSDEKDPKFRKMGLDPNGSPEVVDVAISELVDLSVYRFDKGACIAWGEEVLFACRTSSSVENNRLLSYNMVLQTFDVHEYFVSCMTIYNGTLLAGDSISNNVYVLFSGFDDDESVINGHFESGADALDFDGMKKVKEIILEGLIQINQAYKLYVAVDNGQFVEQKDPTATHAIEGTAAYVDRSQSISVGSRTVGSTEVAGGGEEVQAYPYRHKIKIRLDKFERITYKIEPQGIGYMSLNQLIWRDIRIKDQKLPRKYR